VYYFRKYKPSTSGIFAALGIALAVLAGVMFGIIQGIPTLASGFELFFVNTIGLPFWSGSLVFVLLLVAGLIWGIRYSTLKNKMLLNNVLVGFTVILIGYSTFALTLIRANANPPMNQNQPDDMFSLVPYLQREQYGDTPLLTGPYYNAPVLDWTKGKAYFAPIGDKYKVIDHKPIRNFDPSFTTFFPRMYSDASPSHEQGYKAWSGMDADTKEKPSFGNNLSYFFHYQVNFMYFRYFMWNFAGRQNDNQNADGNVIDGNWISGIPFIDNWRLGNQDNLSDNRKNNPARNRYFFLPLLLGILGVFYLYKKDKQMFWIVFTLFFFTGLAIVLYLNQPPYQPRERDYAYAGSFYAFSIYIGFGVLAIYEWLKKFSPAILAASATAIFTLAVPTLMVAENWNDHDRSGRYTAREFARNYLESCEPNAIIFTNGDNDTFPLWYAQDVEGIRTDIKVINMSYLSTDWYANQQQRKVYDSEPVPFGMTEDQYRQGTRDLIYVYERLKEPHDIRELINFVTRDDTRLQMQNNELINYFPTKSAFLPIDKKQVIGTVVPIKDSAKVVDKMSWDLQGSALRKSDLLVLSLLAHNDWKRPIYWAITVGPDAYVGLQDYFRLDGMAYRLVPIKTPQQGGNLGYVDSDILYDRLMKRFSYGGIDNPKVYLDENNRRMLMNIKNNFVQLALQLEAEQKWDKVKEVVHRVNTLIPDKIVPYNYYNLLMVEPLYKAGDVKGATEMIETLWISNFAELKYFLTLGENFTGQIGSDKDRAMAIMNEILNTSERLGMHSLTDKYSHEALNLLEANLSYLAPFKHIQNESEIYQYYERMSSSSKQDVSLYMQLLERTDSSKKTEKVQEPAIQDSVK
jgi:hypothetical protein